MTLEEAIQHCIEVAEKSEEAARTFGNIDDNNMKDGCLECASEHRQLAEWLRELKEYRESWEELFSTVYEIKANAETEDIKNIASFLVNYMRIFEKRIEEVKADDNN